MSEPSREERANLLVEFDSLFPWLAEREKVCREAFETLKESAPHLNWRFWITSESFLITASFLVFRFDGSQEEFPVAHLTGAVGEDGQVHYSVGFMQATDGFLTHETAIAWLLSRFRQFALKESPDA